MLTKFSRAFGLGVMLAIIALVWWGCSDEGQNPVGIVEGENQAEVASLPTDELVTGDALQEFQLDGLPVENLQGHVTPTFIGPPRICFRGWKAVNVGSFFKPHFVFVFRDALRHVKFSDASHLSTPVNITSDNGKIYWADNPEYWKFTKEGHLGLFVEKSKVRFPLPWVNLDKLARGTTLCIY